MHDLELGWVATMVAALLIVYAPGLLIVRVSRIRLPFAIGFAPAMTAGVFAALALVYHLLSIPWMLLSALIGVLVILAVAYGVGRLAHRDDRLARLHRTGPLPWQTWLILLTGSVVASMTVMLPVRRFSPGIESLISSYDSLFHYNAVQTIREHGNAYPFTALSTMFDGTTTFYPVSFHQLAAIVPGDAVAATNALVFTSLIGMTTATTSLLWVLMPRVARQRGRAVGVALLVPSLYLFFSMPVMTLLVGLWPNALAMSVFPAVLAALVVAARRVIRGVVRTLGAKSTAGAVKLVVTSVVPCLVVVGGALYIHPSVGFSIALFGFALWMAGAVVLLRTRRRLGIAGLLVGLALFAVYDVGSLLYLRGMAQTTKIELPPLSVVLTILADRPRLGAIPLKTLPVVPIYLLAVLGVLWCLRRRRLEELAVLFFAAVTFLVALGAMIPFLPISSLANPWYQARERIFPMLTLSVLCLAGYGIAMLIVHLRTRSRRTRVIAVLVGALVLLLPVVDSAMGEQRLPRLAQVALQRDGYLASYVTRAEREFIESSSELIDDDAVVLGVPSDGTPMYYAIGDRRVIFPHAGYPSSPEQMLIATEGDALLTNPEVCEAVRGYGEQVYFYDDLSAQRGGVIMSELQRNVFGGLDNLDTTGMTVVDESPDGHYRLYELDLPC